MVSKTTKLKIDGLRDASHALVAAEAGADFLGFVFVPGVRRQLAVGQARSIIEVYRQSRPAEPPRILGLFANQPLDEVNGIVRRCGLDMVQLCGDEPPEYWDRVEVPVIKQVKVRDDMSTERAVAETLDRVQEVIRRGHTAVLDKYHANAPGGTGRTFDWAIAREVSKECDFFLAGGLSPENVGEAISTVGPWGVDVSSGVETNGVKDRSKIVAFAKAVRKSDAGTGTSAG